MNEIRRALISVSNKQGVTELAANLSKMGFEIVSTGGTARTLRENNIDVQDVADITGFPEILGGRVKTLNPYIHGGILARKELEDQQKEMREHNIIPIELVVVNLYPFEETIASGEMNHQTIVENIDIGGPTMVRAAAKNHQHVAVIVNPEKYDLIIKELRDNGQVSSETKLILAAEAFSHTAYYDALISSYFNGKLESSSGLYPETITMPLKKMQNLRYGENPQQEAAFYASGGALHGLANAEQLQGKELSFNNLNDLNAAWELVKEFDEPTVVAVKHANPCGVGTAENLSTAYDLAYAADPVSIFGGIIAVNRILDTDTALKLKEIFLEVIAAPGFEDEAKTILSKKKDIRLLNISDLNRSGKEIDIKKINGGLLIQSIDNKKIDLESAKVVTEQKPTDEEWAMLLFSQAVVKHVKSNAIVVAGSGQTYGIGAGQMSRIGAARIAIKQAGEKSKGAVLASDAFFPFPDTVEEAASAGIKAIIQPGGSLKDKDVIDVCNRLGLSMVFTGRRYFKH